MRALHVNRLVVIVLSWAVLHPGPAAGQTQGPPPVPPAQLTGGPRSGGGLDYRVERSTSGFRIDGVLDEPAWQRAATIELPFEIWPGENVPAPARTVCRLAFDNDALYLGCEAFDPRPSEIRAYYTDRDAILDHDRIGIVLDPVGDFKRAFWFGVSPVNVQEDGLYDEQSQNWDLGWDAVWTSAARLTGQGYIIEARIPFRVLRFAQSAAPHAWAFYLWRVWPRSQEFQLSSRKVVRSNSCDLCQSGRLTGLDGLASGRALDLTPTLTSHRTDVRPSRQSSHLSPGAARAEAGLDLRWGITPDLSANLAVNPDFSQVEADAPQLEANRRFAISYSEKRPFFLEGADLFDTPLRAVFSRTITDPLAGGKLSGKMGKTVVGVIVARDEITNLLFPGSQTSATDTRDAPATVVIGRFRRDISPEVTVGALVTDREGEGYLNRVAGVDSFVRFSKSTYLRTQALHSTTEYPATVADADGQPHGTFSDVAFHATLRHESRQWLGWLRVESFGPRFRADAGFIPEVDNRWAYAGLERRFQGDASRWFSRIQVGPMARYGEDLAGHPRYRDLALEVTYQGPWYTSVVTDVARQQEVFSGTVFDTSGVFVTGSMRPRGALGFTFAGQYGRGIDYANSRQADLSRLEPGVRVRVGRHLDLQLNYSREWLSAAGAQILKNQAGQGRITYSFTSRMFVRTTVQLQDTLRNPSLFRSAIDHRNTNVLSQILASYRVNPQTVIFLGYGDTRTGLTNIDAGSTSLREMERTFFLKLGYAWRPPAHKPGRPSSGGVRDPAHKN